MSDWACRVTIGGTVTSVTEFHCDYARGSAATGTLAFALPLPSQVTDLATCRVEFGKDGSYFDVFNGFVLVPTKTLDLSGAVATLPIVGKLYKTTFPLNADKAFTGGARASATSLSLGSTYLHMGTQTIAWYGNTTPNGGTSVDKTFTPGADSTFLYIAGRLHGTNSYDASTGDKAIKDHSKIIILQGGVELDRAFFPESNEAWSSMLDYTNDANWSDFELYFAFTDPQITSGGGNVTVRFHSGRKPGSSDYDEYEVKAVTWQLAGQNTIRSIVRGTFKYCGLVANTDYLCNDITDLSGTTQYLGGNGLVDHGQIRLAANDVPLDFVTRVAGLYGFAPVDCPDGVIRVLPFRGVPHGTARATFTEGVNAYSVTDNEDAGNVYNAVVVTGASVTDQNGAQKTYAASTSSPAAHPLIPNPPGVRAFAVSDQFLASNLACQKVRNIQEEIHADALTSIDWEADPVALKLGDVIAIQSPTVGIDGRTFLINLGYDYDLSNGAHMRCSGWTGTASTLTETDDPNPTETDTVPSTPRPSSRPNTEWKAYRPKGSLN